jgi:hypothetical protein
MTETDLGELMSISDFGVGRDARERLEPGLGWVPADLADERDLVQPRDLALALDPRRVISGQTADQRSDPLAQLQREVGGRSAHELAHVLDGYLVVGTEAIWMLGLTHFCGTTSRRLSIWAWTATEMVLGSPITHPWL